MTRRNRKSGIYRGDKYQRGERERERAKKRGAKRAGFQADKLVAQIV